MQSCINLYKAATFSWLVLAAYVTLVFVQMWKVLKMNTRKSAEADDDFAFK